MVLLSLPVVPVVVEKKTIAFDVDVLTPFKILFLIVLLVASLIKRTTDPVVFVFEMVRFLLVVPLFEPSMII